MSQGIFIVDSNIKISTQEVLAERLGALSSLTRSGVRPLSSSAANLLGNPCHRGRGLVWAKPGIPWFTPKKKILQFQLSK
jgi:hypothetical protein